MKEILSLIAALAVLVQSLGAYAQTTSKNYIAVRTFHTPIKASDRDLRSSLQPGKSSTHIAYQDALGRQIQTQQTNFSTNAKTLVQHIQYDANGQQTKQFLPLVNFKRGHFQNHAAQAIQKYYRTPEVYAQTLKDSTGLERPKESGGTGKHWAVGGAHSTKYTYGWNQHPLKTWNFNDQTQKFETKTYPTGTLKRTSLTNIAGNTTHQYTELLHGKKIITEQVAHNSQTGKNQYLRTHRVYDRWGQLRALVPPKAQDIQDSSLVYQYHYTGRLLTRKQIPGAGTTRLSYDDLDRLSSSTDAKGIKSYLTYNKFNQLVETGILINQALKKHFPHYAKLPIGTKYALTQRFYNHYNFPFAKANPFKAKFNNQQWKHCFGLPTGTRTRLMGTNQWVETVNYYNQDQRLCQSFVHNNLGGVDQIDTRFSFAGQIRQEHIHKSSHHKKYTVKTLYDYYPNGQIKKLYQQINNQPRQELAHYSYNDLNKLKTKTLNLGKQAVHYSYHPLKNWLTKIHAPKLFEYELFYHQKALPNSVPKFDGTPSASQWRTEQQGADRHTYNYHYDKQNQLTAAHYQSSATGTPQDFSTQYAYDANGNINRLQRMGHIFQNEYDTLHHFQYHYRGNQLKTLERKTEREVNVLPGNINQDDFVNGNDLIALHQFPKDSVPPRPKHLQGTHYNMNTHQSITAHHSLVDRLHADANGNGRISMQDTAAIWQNLGQFRNFTDGKVESHYRYDANGNLLEDSHKGLKLFYNLNNQVVRMLLRDSLEIRQQFLADGTLMKRKHYRLKQGKRIDSTILDFQGLFTFKNSQLHRLTHPEGFYTFEDMQLQTHYQLTDHLGNTRLVFNQDQTTQAVYAYYPYGKLIQELSRNWGFSSSQYQGKQYLSEPGYYDFHARYYDAELGKWHAVDPALQMLSPYTAMGNNPVVYVDPDGEFITWSLSSKGFSIGLNLTLSGIPLGGGFNFGWEDGFSIGTYREVGYRVGGTGWGAGATLNHSIDYNFKHESFSSSVSVGTYAAYGLVSGGVSTTYGYDFTKEQGSWTVSAGAGLGLAYEDGSYSVGLNAGVGYDILNGKWTGGSMGIGGQIGTPIEIKRVIQEGFADEKGGFLGVRTHNEQDGFTSDQTTRDSYLIEIPPTPPDGIERTYTFSAIDEISSAQFVSQPAHASPIAKIVGNSISFSFSVPTQRPFRLSVYGQRIHNILISDNRYTSITSLLKHFK